MAIHAVSYDLRKPGRDYQSLYQRLAAWKAFRVLQSVWIIQSTSNAVVIRDDLMKHVDKGDGLLVGELTRDAAWYNLDGQSGANLLNAYN